jgi:branched-chain amino acid transport system permease protein
LLSVRAAALRPTAGLALAKGLWPYAAAIGVALLIQLVLKPVLGAYDAILMLNVGIAIILAVSLNIVNGFTGQFSIGHAGFLAVGGYASGVVTYYTSMLQWGNGDMRGGVLSGMPLDTEGLAFITGADFLFLASIIIGGLVAAVVGFLVGLPSLRLKGDYLAIVTLGFGEIVRVMIQNTQPVLKTAEAVREAPIYMVPVSVGQSLGFGDIPKYTSLFWVYLVCCVTLVVAYRLKTSTFGRAFLSIRENEIASEAMGVNTTRFKVWAFVIAAFFAGVAGGLYSHTLGVSLSPVDAGFQKSFDFIIMVVLGGLGSVSGATLAAIIVTLLPEYLRGFIVETGTVLLVVGGLIGFFSGMRLILNKRSGRRLEGRTKVAAVAGGVLILLGIVGPHVMPAGLGGEINLGDFRMIIYALLLILMMIFRPKGLFGVHEVWDKAIWAWLTKRFTGGSNRGSGGQS